MHFFVPFFFPSVVFLSSFSFLFCLIKVCGFTQCDIVCICFSSFWGHVLWLWSRVDFNFSARSPSPCFCPVGWMKRTKSNDLPSPSSKPVKHWCSQMIFLEPFIKVLKCLKVTGTDQAPTLSTVTPKSSRALSFCFPASWCPAGAGSRA